MLRHNPDFFHGFFEPSTVLMSRPTAVYPSNEESVSQDNKTVFRSIDANAHESDDLFTLTMDLPGVKSDKLTVQVEGCELSVSADRPTANGSVVAYRQSFTVDEDTVDADKLKATLADGVLTLTLPKKEEAKPIEVPVFEGDAAAGTKEDLRITFDFPGVKAADLKAVVHNGLLTIKGNCKKGNSVARIQRTMTLDRHRTDLTQLKAYLADGVLTITAPHKEHDAPKTIKLNGEDQPKQNVLVESVPAEGSVTI